MINPELKPFLETWDAHWAVLPADAGVQNRRVLFEQIADAMRLPQPSEVSASNAFFKSGERYVWVRIDRHDDSGDQPCLIYMHGGGWMQGSPKTHADITSRIAAANRQTVISVDYALAPEHPFPAAVNEVMDAVRWAKDNAKALGIDPAKIAIGGDSAGGNLAAGACIGLRDTHYAPMAQLLIYPATDFEMDKPSYVENADAPLLKVKGMATVNAMYLPNEAERRNPLAAPLYAPSHVGLPQAYLAVAENDPLRDDGKYYAEKLAAAGVPVEVDNGEGLIHGYLRAMEYCAASRQSLTRMCAWLAKCYQIA